MDILPENMLPAEENSIKVQDQEWNRCRTPDRRHADALLSISEEGFAKDEDAYELSTESGWDEAVSNVFTTRCCPSAGLREGHYLKNLSIHFSLYILK